MSAEFSRYIVMIVLGLMLLAGIYFGLVFFIRRSKYHDQKIWSKLPFVNSKTSLIAKIAAAVELFLLLICIGFTTSILVQEPKVVLPNSPALEATEISIDSPFKIVFDRPINRDSMVKTISPDLPGNWSYASTGYLIFTDTIIFTPTVSPVAESRYTISLENIQTISGGTPSNYLLSFMTPPLPNVTSVNPANGTEGVLQNQEIIIETDYAHEDLARLEFFFTPTVEFAVTKESDTKYILRTVGGFKKSTTYRLDINRIPITRNYENNETTDIGEATLISQTTFNTLEAPGVSEYEPKGSGVLSNKTIWIEFKQDMNRAATEEAFSVNPSVTGTISWESNRKMVLTPSADLAKNTAYTVSVSEDAQAIDGSPFEAVFQYTFTTIGPVTVSSFYPGNNATGLATNTSTTITFNQAVDHASAESKFSISPNVSGSFSWSGNTLTFNHDSFSYVTKYTMSVASGIKTVYGQDSVQAYSSSFTTKQQSITLNVPSYAQVHMYSCMAAAARSALAYRGVYVSENTLLSQIGYDSTAFSGTWGDPNAIWGNPYSGIVGNVDGKSGGITWGYGAYWGPTANAISNYRSTAVKTSWDVSSLAQEIANGNPVLIWWVNGVWPSYEVYWKTSGGTAIRGVNGMHVQVVKGFTGTIANPTSFTVTDSGYGYPSHTYDVSTFKAKWSWFGNSAVIVY